MATQFLFSHSRPTAFVVRRVGGKVNAGAVRLVKPATPRREKIRMTKVEASVFFNICENPSPEPIEMFNNLRTVAQWFKD